MRASMRIQSINPSVAVKDVDHVNYRCGACKTDIVQDVTRSTMCGEREVLDIRSAQTNWELLALLD
jgi:hypothetical protein